MAGSSATYRLRRRVTAALVSRCRCQSSGSGLYDASSLPAAELWALSSSGPSCGGSRGPDQLDPDGAKRTLSRAHLRSSQKEPRAFFRKALSLDPNDRDILYFFSLALYNSNRPADARDARFQAVPQDRHA